MPRSQKRERVERNLYRAGRTFYACATPPGQRQAQWKTLGEIGVMEARRLRDEFVASVRSGECSAPADARVTFASVAEKWLDRTSRLVEIGDMAPRTLESYEAALNLHILPTFGRRPIRSITAADLVGWHEEQKLNGCAAWSIKARWTALRGVLGYAARFGPLTSNPADLLERRERPQSGAGRVRVLTRDEMDRLLRATTPAYHPAIVTAMFTGARLSEVLGLVWEDIDFEEQVIRLRFQMGRDGKRRRLKTGAGARDIVLMRELAQLLRRHRLASPHSQENDLLFATRTGRTIGQRNLSARGLDRAVERAGLQGVTMHTLRHTFVSLLIEQGRTPVFVADQIGHSNPAFTMKTYAHLFNAAQHAREARDALDSEFGGMLRGS